MAHARDFKDTVNLPRTAFSMKANLTVAEPAMIAHWLSIGLYQKIRARRRGAPSFILHDGPPYANGRIHLGTALNKILKDFVVKSKTMAGFDSPYVPGWDCHGLPIERQLDRELGGKKQQMSVVAFRRACRRYAEKYVKIQRDDFERLGILGEWDEPYLTMSYAYEAAIIQALAHFVKQGLVYKGKKPVHWCIHDRTALAEAEVEYEAHTSPSIWVEFPLADSSREALARRIPPLANRLVSVLIWTTTPWTIPSNLAVAFHPNFTYGAYPVGDQVVIVGKELAEAVSQKTRRTFSTPLATFTGRELEYIRFRHPLYDRDSLGVLGDYVTLNQGTGAVHTAPGHGADDFATGLQYGLPIDAPVDAGGRFLRDVPLFGGLQVFDANPAITKALAEAGRLWASETIDHDYPHCWRCKNPVIFLATAQWFIAMDTQGGRPATDRSAGLPDGKSLRERSLEAVKQIAWYPAWGEERMANMLAARPDWCISRQRQWGVPIPAVYCTECGEPTLAEGVLARAAEIFSRDGADAWHERPVGDFVPSGFACPKCGGTAFEKERDILDVWFDAGTSHEVVLGHRADLPWPAEVYLEGSDQYRGWFHSSLLIGIATRGQAPYRQVITHGFTVDAEGRKMSKSIGNTIEPQAIIRKSGAEILRLWVAASDYREDLRLSPEILSRIVEAYRKIRNTARYLVANLYDFDPRRDAVAPDALPEIDRWALARWAAIAARVRNAYDQYEFHTVFHAINSFAAGDLSAVYIDVSKDRLYTSWPGAPERRAAQTVLYRIADSLARLIAPILSVTAEEIWKHLPGPREESVLLADVPSDLDTLRDDGLISRWEPVMAVRDEVNRALEAARNAKLIGNALEARLLLHGSDAMATLLRAHVADWPMLCIVSQVTLLDSPDGLAQAAGVPGLWLGVVRADGSKCERCWTYRTTVGQDATYPTLCDRCVAALAHIDAA